LKQAVLKTYKSYTQANRYTIYCQLSQNPRSVKKFFLLSDVVVVVATNTYALKLIIHHHTHELEYVFQELLFGTCSICLFFFLPLTRQPWWVWKQGCSLYSSVSWLLSSRSLDKGILRPIFVFESCKNTKGIYDTWDISQDCEEETYPKLHLQNKAIRNTQFQQMQCPIQFPSKTILFH
jgi:hypothetical protein